MSYIVSFKTGTEYAHDIPQWFHDRAKICNNEWRHNGVTGSWIWIWNSRYQEKLRISDGKYNVHFPSEKDYLWFLLKEQ